MLTDFMVNVKRTTSNWSKSLFVTAVGEGVADAQDANSKTHAISIDSCTFEGKFYLLAYLPFVKPESIEVGIELDESFVNIRAEASVPGPQKLEQLRVKLEKEMARAINPGSESLKSPEEQRKQSKEPVAEAEVKPSERELGREILWHNIESKAGKFSRKISLPKSLDIANLASVFADGILFIHIPNHAEIPPQAVPIAKS